MKGKEKFIKDISGKSVKELVELRRDLREKRFKLKSKHAMKALTKTSEISKLTKDIARVSTVLTLKIQENYGGNRK